MSSKSIFAIFALATVLFPIPSPRVQSLGLDENCDSKKKKTNHKGRINCEQENIFLNIYKLEIVLVKNLNVNPFVKLQGRK